MEKIRLGVCVKMSNNNNNRTKKNKARNYIEKSPEAEEFIYYVRKCGGSSHIMLGKRWLGRYVQVKIQEVKEE